MTTGKNFTTNRFFFTPATKNFKQVSAIKSDRVCCVRDEWKRVVLRSFFWYTLVCECVCVCAHGLHSHGWREAKIVIAVLLKSGRNRIYCSLIRNIRVFHYEGEQLSMDGLREVINFLTYLLHFGLMIGSSSIQEGGSFGKKTQK